MISLAEVDAAALEQWLKILFWLAGGIAAVAVAFGHLTGKSGKREIQTPLEVRAAADLITKRDHEKQIDELKGEIAKLDGERRTSVANLHTKIDQLATRLDDRIDEIPRRTIALLNETKQLHAAK